MSAFEPADSSADSPAEAETLFAAECGRRVHIFQKWCALLQRQLRWQVHLHLLQGCELLETKSGDLQEYELFQRSNLHQLECKYFGSPTQSVANFVSMSDESDTPTMPEGHPTFGPIKPTPTVQCSEDIALIPGSGNALGNVPGEPPTISEDFSPRSPADDIVTKSPLISAMFQFNHERSNVVLSTSFLKWKLQQSDGNRPQSTVKLKVEYDLVLSRPAVKLKFWQCAVLSRPTVKLKFGRQLPPPLCHAVDVQFHFQCL